MKSVFAAIAIVFAINVVAVEVPEKLLDAIATVESNNDDKAIGDKGRAIGRFQIWKTYVDEVNRICRLKKNGKTFSYEDRKDAVKSREMVRIYLEFWGRQYERNTGKKATFEVLAKIHNGHAFWKRSNTKKNEQYFKNLESYWIKVSRELNSK